MIYPLIFNDIDGYKYMYAQVKILTLINLLVAWLHCLNLPCPDNWCRQQLHGQDRHCLGGVYGIYKPEGTVVEPQAL